MFKKFIDRFIFGKKRFQSVFSVFHRVWLLWMNYGRWSDPLVSWELYVAKKFLKSWDTIFDVGTNYWQYLNMLLDVTSKKNISFESIHCFEPNDICQSSIEEIIKHNKKQYIQYNKKILSEFIWETIFYTSNKDSWLSSVYNRRLDHRDIQLNQEIVVEKTTIDIYCELYNIKKIDFLKIDVEWHELSVLQWAKGMIQSWRIPIIQFEFWWSNIDSKTYFQDFWYFFWENNYKLYRIIEDGLIEIKRYKEIDEIFTTINYLAILKNNDKS